MKLINLALITIFIILDKNELIDDVIEYSVCDIEDFYGCFEHNLSASEKEHIEKIIDKRGDNNHTKKQVKLLIFNNKHKTNQI